MVTRTGDINADDTKPNDISNTIVLNLVTPKCETQSPPTAMKPIMLLILIAVTSTFSGGYEFYIVNTAMRQFQIFVNNSMTVRYNWELSSGQLDLLWVVALQAAAVGYLCGHILTPILVENIGRKGI